MAGELLDKGSDADDDQRLRDLVASAQSGNREVLPELQDILDHRPDIWKSVGDLAGRALEYYVQLCSGNDEFSRECIRRQLRKMRRKLLGKKATPLEKLLIERILVGWVQLQYADLLRSVDKDVSIRMRSFLEQRVNTIQRRYLAAIKELARVRVLLGLQQRVKGTGRGTSSTANHKENEVNSGNLKEGRSSLANTSLPPRDVIPMPSASANGTAHRQR